MFQCLPRNKVSNDVEAPCSQTAQMDLRLSYIERCDTYIRLILCEGMIDEPPFPPTGLGFGPKAALLLCEMTLHPSSMTPLVISSCTIGIGGFARRSRERGEFGCAGDIDPSQDQRGGRPGFGRPKYESISGIEQLGWVRRAPLE